MSTFCGAKTFTICPVYWQIRTLMLKGPDCSPPSAGVVDKPWPNSGTHLPSEVSWYCVGRVTTFRGKLLSVHPMILPKRRPKTSLYFQVLETVCLMWAFYLVSYILVTFKSSSFEWGPNQSLHQKMFNKLFTCCLPLEPTTQIITLSSMVPWQMILQRVSSSIVRPPSGSWLITSMTATGWSLLETSH